MNNQRKIKEISEDLPEGWRRLGMQRKEYKYYSGELTYRSSTKYTEKMAHDKNHIEKGTPENRRKWRQQKVLTFKISPWNNIGTF